jgi:hypothetical protein
MYASSVIHYCLTPLYNALNNRFFFLSLTVFNVGVSLAPTVYFNVGFFLMLETYLHTKVSSL